ncbi:MAG: MaoC family dehydratase [Deltaproteobacteria bacterium]
MKMSDLQIGIFKELNRSFSRSEVVAFAELTGDINPIHLDSEFAKTTIFKAPIVHGMLYSSLLSSLIANELPGPGSIYKAQTLNFTAPVYYDEPVTARVTVKEVLANKGICVLETVIFKSNTPEIVVVTGEAVIKKIEL